MKQLLKSFDVEDRLNKNRHLLNTARIDSVDAVIGWRIRKGQIDAGSAISETGFLKTKLLKVL